MAALPKGLGAPAPAWPEGAVAQLGERLVRNEEVSGSIPLGSTSLRPPSGGCGWQASLHDEEYRKENRGAKAVRRSSKSEDGQVRYA
jgi:hypothetical protein